MSVETGQTVALWPMVVYSIAVLVIVAAMIGLSCLLGERHRERQTAEPYESGIVSTGSARIRFDVKFYLMAVFFVVFDLESVFIFGWAIGFRELGWAGYAGVIFFVGTLIAALVYLWRMGALTWGAAAGHKGAHELRERGLP